MSMIAATCLTISAALATAQGGDTIRLEGDCPTIKIERQFPSKVTIDATGARVAGVQFVKAKNVGWRGGTVVAPKGMFGIARDGYAFTIAEAENISVSYTDITGARMGAVIQKSRNVDLDHNRFSGLRSDGFNVSRTINMAVKYNSFTDPRPNPNTCDGVPTELAMRHCFGVWKGGDHGGAGQIWDGSVNVRVTYNFVHGKWGGGFSQNDQAGVSAPLTGLLLGWNWIHAATYSPLQAQANCINCSIRYNFVRNGRPDWKATIKYGAAAHCGNEVEAGPPDHPC